MAPKNIPTLCIACLLMISLAVPALAQTGPGKVADAPNGISFFPDYAAWQVLSVSQRSDNNTMRAILANPIAMKAAHAGQTVPWPDGAVIAKVVWKQKTHENWPAALVPGEFVQVEFMVKDKMKFAATKGWGWARWKGTELAPYGKDASFAQECVDCHMPVAANDFVFTKLAPMPVSSVK